MSKAQVKFRASFPPIQTAIRIDGMGGGMRIQLDIPESEMHRAIALVALREAVLLVTVDLDDGRPTLAANKEKPDA